MSFNLEMSPEKLAVLIRKGVEANLEDLIKKELMDHIDPIISELARNLARQTAVHVHSFIDHQMGGVRVGLMFNNPEVTYEAERTFDGRVEGHNVPPKDGVAR